jgi:hypothetical protein
MEMSKIDKYVRQGIINDLLSSPNPNKSYIAMLHKVGRGTVYRIAKELGETERPSDLATDRKIRALQKSARESEQRYQESIKVIEELESSLESFRSCEGLLDVCSPISLTAPKSKGSNAAVPFLIASDWHIDEVVNKDEIGGVNNFNLKVARKRVNDFFHTAIRIINIYKKDSDIDTLVLAALGDFMSAWIHEELIQTNSLSPPDTVLELLEMWIGGMDAILESGVVKNILFVGAVGNHGRITKRIQFKERHKKSYEWILYNLLAKHYATKGETRIKFQLPSGYFNWIKVFGRNIRLHHGDNIRYQGGIGGIHIPVRKALAQWNKVRPADLDIFGHWHTMEWSESYVINNSLIGYSTYAENIKADFMKAGQSIFLLHNKHGKTGQFPIVLQD